MHIIQFSSMFFFYDWKTGRRSCHFTFLGARHNFSGLLSVSLRACAYPWFVELKIFITPALLFVTSEIKLQRNCCHLISSSFVRSWWDPHFLGRISVKLESSAAGFCYLLSLFYQRKSFGTFVLLVHDVQSHLKGSTMLKIFGDILIFFENL